MNLVGRVQILTVKPKELLERLILRLKDKSFGITLQIKITEILCLQLSNGQAISMCYDHCDIRKRSHRTACVEVNTL